jgi:ribosomal protein S18 acetylase RimI-like enzyme
MDIPISHVTTRNTLPRDFDGISDLCKRVYPDTSPWNSEQLSSHLRLFPQGQFVSVTVTEQKVVGMAASLIVHWDHYHMLDDWEQFTADGMFTNHDPEHGHTLYGAEVIVDPEMQHHGIGDMLYHERRNLTETLKLRRIRAGSRLRGYHAHYVQMAPEDYVKAVVRGTEYDPTLSFQLREGFHVLAVVPHYLSEDPASLGYAAVIEWLNPEVIRPEHTVGRPIEFLAETVMASEDHQNGG